MSHNGLMAKKDGKADRHKPSRMVRVRKRVAAQAQAFADESDKDFTEAVNDLLVESLRRHNLWPPPEEVE